MSREKTPVTIQRTLIVALGEAGVRVAQGGLISIQNRLGSIPILGCVNLVVGDTTLEHVTMPEPCTYSASNMASEQWATCFQTQCVEVLRQISRLEHIADLTRLGFGLARPNEIHIIVVVDLLANSLKNILFTLMNLLASTVEQSLGVYASFTGLFLQAELGNDEMETSFSANPIAEFLSPETPHRHDAPPFDRGCFLMCNANEHGLNVGSRADIEHYAARFIELLVTTPLSSAVEFDISADACSAGIAILQWPGHSLANVLSHRAVADALAWITDNLYAQTHALTARRATRHFLSDIHTSPSMIAQDASPLLPKAPDHLDTVIPASPWPWNLQDAYTLLQAIRQQWEKEWSMVQPGITRHLQEHAGQWGQSMQTWLENQMKQPEKGLMPTMVISLKAVDQLMAEYDEGLQARLEEIVADAIAIDAQLEQMSGQVKTQLEALPDSPLELLVVWGGRPLRWPTHWHHCFRIQNSLTHYARLLKAQFAAQQSLRLYKLTQKHFQSLMARWNDISTTMHLTLAQFQQAADERQTPDWPAEIKTILKHTNGPWTSDIIESIYNEIIDLNPEIFWKQAAGLEKMLNRDTPTTPTEIIQVLQSQARCALAPLADMPVETALRRQLPDKRDATRWVHLLVEQSAPFWPLDESAMTETCRASSGVIHWLLTAGGKASPLAQLCQDLPHPVEILDGADNSELTAVSIRYGVSIRTGNNEMCSFDAGGDYAR